MNVGILVYDLSRKGGSERVAVNLSNGLISEHNIYLISCYNSNREEKLYPILDRVTFKILVNDAGDFTKYHKVIEQELEAYIKLNKLEVIIVVGLDAAYFACVAKKKIGVPIIACEHSNLNNKLYNKWRKRTKRNFAVRNSDSFVTLTQKDMHAYQKKYDKYRDKFTYIYNWIDDELACNSTDYDIDSHKIVTVCRIDPVKNLENAIEIASNVLNKDSDWTWEVYGGGDSTYLDKLKGEVSRKGLEKKFMFMGQTDNIVKAYSHHAIYVCTSSFEGLPMSLLEAKCFHLPIVSFDCMTGPSDIIIDKINGNLVPVNDVKQAVKFIFELINNRNKRQRYSDHAWDNIDKFRKSNILVQWNNLIESVTKK